MSVIVKVEEADRNELERLHYEVNGLADLITRISSGVNVPENVDEIVDKYTAKYCAKFKEYEVFKDFITSKYKPHEGVKSWNMNFEACELTFEE